MFHMLYNHNNNGQSIMYNIDISRCVYNSNSAMYLCIYVFYTETRGDIC